MYCTYQYGREGDRDGEPSQEWRRTSGQEACSACGGRRRWGWFRRKKEKVEIQENFEWTE